MSVRVRVLRCECSKVHVAAGIGPISECSCGRRLWRLLWDGTAK